MKGQGTMKLAQSFERRLRIKHAWQRQGALNQHTRWQQHRIVLKRMVVVRGARWLCRRVSGPAGVACCAAASHLNSSAELRMTAASHMQSNHAVIHSKFR